MKPNLLALGILAGLVYLLWPKASSAQTKTSSAQTLSRSQIEAIAEEALKQNIAGKGHILSLDRSGWSGSSWSVQFTVQMDEGFKDVYTLSLTRGGTVVGINQGMSMDPNWPWKDSPD